MTAEGMRQNLAKHASPLPLAKLRDALGTVKGDLGALFGGSGSNPGTIGSGGGLIVLD